MILRLYILISFFILAAHMSPVMADDIDCQNEIQTCPPTPSPCGCPPATSLTVTSSTGGDVIDGTIISVSGGRAPYSFSFDGGVIEKTSKTTGEVTDITACSLPGQTNYGTLSVADACGPPVTNEVPLPEGGYWNPTGQDCYYPNCYNPYENIHVEINGTEKKDIYVKIGCCLIEADNGVTGTCPPEGDNLYQISGISGEFCERTYNPLNGAAVYFYGETYVTWYVKKYYSLACQ